MKLLKFNSTKTKVVAMLEDTIREEGPGMEAALLYFHRTDGTSGLAHNFARPELLLGHLARIQYMLLQIAEEIDSNLTPA